MALKEAAHTEASSTSSWASHQVSHSDCVSQAAATEATQAAAIQALCAVNLTRHQVHIESLGRFMSFSVNFPEAVGSSGWLYVLVLERVWTTYCPLTSEMIRPDQVQKIEELEQQNDGLEQDLDLLASSKFEPELELRQPEVICLLDGTTFFFRRQCLLDDSKEKEEYQRNGSASTQSLAQLLSKALSSAFRAEPKEADSHPPCLSGAHLFPDAHRAL